MSDRPTNDIDDSFDQTPPFLPFAPANQPTTVERWFLSKSHQTLGPYTRDQLREMVQAKSLEASDMVKREGSAQWERAGTMPWLFADSASDETEVPLSAVDPSTPGDLAAPPTLSGMPTSCADEDAGSRIGPFKLLQPLGEGGMGVVWLAEQKEPVKRRVALKIIKSDLRGKQILARFEAERQAITMMDHPNIAKVLDVGETSTGRPFFAMELVQGVPFTKHCDKEKLTLGERLELFIPVCHAVQHAHQKGIIHRDLKPSNVLIAIYDGQPVPKVIDFGVAKATHQKLTERTMYTEIGQIIGTPEYMAPEQAELNIHEIDARADIYSLGVMLYEIITGHPPFTAKQLRGEAFLEMLRLIREVEPAKPSTLLSSSLELPAISANRKLEPATLVWTVHGDLDSIVMKCLEKEKARRYSTALELADDVQRWLDDKPVKAHPRNLRHRISRWIGKHPRKIASAGMAMLASVALWFALADIGYSLPGGRSLQRWLDRHEASLFRPAASEAELKAAVAKHRGELRELLVQRVQPNNGWHAPPTKVPDVWSQMQLSVALFHRGNEDHSDIQKCVRVLDLAFEQNGYCDPFEPNLGWITGADGNYSTEASGWGLSAFAKVLASALTTPADRKRLLERLDQLQTALDNCQTINKTSGQPNGGWNLFPRQEFPEQHNIYITALVGQGLLDLRTAGLPWRNSVEQRDRRLKQTLEMLIAQFDGRGWTTPGRLGADAFNDGLTLQIFGMLLEAENAGLVTLPKAITDQISRHLAECGSRTLDHKSTVTLFLTSLRRDDGKLAPLAQRAMTSLWYPWSIKCASGWYIRCKNNGAPHDDLVSARRVLHHLVITLGPGAVDEVRQGGMSFAIAETLLGFSSCPP